MRDILGRVLTPEDSYLFPVPRVGYAPGLPHQFKGECVRAAHACVSGLPICDIRPIPPRSQGSWEGFWAAYRAEMLRNGFDTSTWYAPRANELAMGAHLRLAEVPRLLRNDPTMLWIGIVTGSRAGRKAATHALVMKGDQVYFDTATHLRPSGQRPRKFYKIITLHKRDERQAA